jgi:hypothetical protein
VRGKPRPRRIASDEAHSWARNLRLGNPLGKLVLMMITGYVNGEGICFVGQESLSEDCELAVNTISKRLGWLEKIGAISRRPRWRDGNGVRNSEGRGKRTTDDIQLMLFADIDEIEEAAHVPEHELDAFLSKRSQGISPPRHGGQVATSSPPPHGGQNGDCPAVAPQQPPSCVGATDSSEPEPEDSPPTPSGGESERSEVSEVEPEPEHFAPAWQSWPGHEVMRRDLALAEFRKLTPDKRLLCRAAIPKFFEMQRHLKRDHIPNFHLWIRSRGFEEFPTATLADAPSGSQGSSNSYAVESVEGRALKALFGLARTSLSERNGRVIYPLPVTARVIAFAVAPPESAWHWIQDRAQVAAWSAFLSTHIHRPRPEILTTRRVGAELSRGFHAPWPWPPRKDGMISASPQAGENE